MLDQPFSYSTAIFITIPMGNTAMITQGWKNISLIFAMGTVATVTNSRGETIDISSPCVFGATPDNQPIDSWDAMEIEAVNGDVIVVRDGAMLVTSPPGGGGGGGGDATAANQAIQISQLNSIIDLLDITSAANGNVLTDVVGSTWVALANNPCERCIIVNSTNVDIEVRQGGAGTGMPVVGRSWFDFEGITNTNQLEVRRIDQANTPITINFRLEV